MPRYTTIGFINAWVRSAFGLLIALFIWYILGSFFLGAMAFAVLCFVPMNSESLEHRVNGGWFAAVMYVLLLLSFWDYGGLGIDLGEDIGSLSTSSTVALAVILGVLVAGLVIYSTIWFKGGSKFYRWSKKSISELMPAQSFWKKFWVILLVILFIAFVLQSAPWNWSFSAIIFVTMWFIAVAGGVVGGIQTKQTIGIVMLIVSFFIYTFGVGSDQVGAAAFGDWWPQVHDFGKNTLGPVADSFSNMFKSFKEAIEMLTCPTCAARNIVDSVYANPEGGRVGSFGLEFEELTVPDGKLNLGRPFSVTMSLKNQGAKDAENVNLDLLVSKTDYKKGEWIVDDDDKKTFEESKNLEEVPVEDAKQLVVVGELTCNGLKKTGIAEGKSLLRQGAESVASKTGLIKTEATNYNLKNYIVPVKAVANYSYKMDSTISLEFISKNERERLVKEKKLEKKKVKGTMTTSPLAISLSADVDQPVTEKTRFYPGLGIKMQEKDAVSGPVKIKMKFPKGWIKSLTKVTGAKEGEIKNEWASVNKEENMKAFYDHTVSENKDAFGGFGKEPAIYKKDIATDTVELIVYKVTEDAYPIFFDFPTDMTDLKGKPTETFVITAESEFSVIKWREVSAKFEFGGFCCKNIQGACQKNQVCNAESDNAPGNCVTSTQPVSDIAVFGDPNYCEKKAKADNRADPCDYGDGGCTDEKQCRDNDKDGGNTCIGVPDLTELKVCCSKTQVTENKLGDCKTDFETRLKAQRDTKKPTSSP